MNYLKITAERYTLDVSTIGGYFDLLPKDLLNIIGLYIENDMMIDRLNQINYLRSLIGLIANDSTDYVNKYINSANYSVAFMKPDWGEFEIIFTDRKLRDKYAKKYEPLFKSKYQMQLRARRCHYTTNACMAEIESLIRYGFDVSYGGLSAYDVSRYIKINGFGDFELDVEAILKL